MRCVARPCHRARARLLAAARRRRSARVLLGFRRVAPSPTGDSTPACCSLHAHHRFIVAVDHRDCHSSSCSSASQPPPSRIASTSSVCLIMLRPPTFDTASRLGKLQLGTLALTLIANTCAFFATLTPSWQVSMCEKGRDGHLDCLQVAEDLDTGRSVKSGLWIYCPGNGLNCWYIFSDDLVTTNILINQDQQTNDCRLIIMSVSTFVVFYSSTIVAKSCFERLTSLVCCC